MALINKIEVETWTRNETGAATDDRIDCIITFMDNSSFQQQLNNPNFDDFQQGHRNRFNLALPTSALSQQHTNIKSLTIKKINGTNTWKCGAVGIRVNDVAILSRYVTADLTSSGSSFNVLLRKTGVLDGLEVKVTTGSWGGNTLPSTDDQVYLGLKFANGANEIMELQITSTENDFEYGTTYSYLIPLPADPFTQTPATIDELKLKKNGSDGWLLAGAVLYGNGDVTPILGNNNIHQWLDNTNKALNIREWSSKRVSGPVLGYISDTTANIQFRIEREGTYRLQIFNHGSGTPLQTLDKVLEPAGVFTFLSLIPNTCYDIKFFLILNNQAIAIPNTDASFRTAPPEGAGVEFSFGIGSCLRNRDNVDQTVWQKIKDVSLDPAIDIVNNPPLNNLRFFIHTGDSHYFFDDVPDQELLSLGAIQPAASTGHLSSRLNANFLTMAKQVPTCAVWDDHDHRYNNLSSGNITELIKGYMRDAFLTYWGNPAPFVKNATVNPVHTFGLTTRITYGNVDIYLMDGRSERIKNQGVFFGTPQIDFVLQDIQNRGTNRLRIFASGSLWNHTENGEDEKYGHSNYDSEREYFYSALNNLISQGKTKGIIFISGDIHQSEMYEVKLAQTGIINVAPEFVCSPLGFNDSGLHAAQSITGERKWSKSATIADGSHWGFASILINTKGANWTVEITYRKFDTGDPFKTKLYTLNNNQFTY